MNGINNLSLYNDRMKKGMLDKVFFLKHIVTDLYFDYGCADAAMIDFIATIFPDKTFIGFDTNEDMIKLAKSKNISNAYFFSDFSEAKKKLIEFQNQRMTSTLILSSLIHEVYSYLNNNEIKEFWNRVYKNKFDYIAIRDMFNNEVERLILKQMVDSENARQVRANADPVSLKQFEEIYGPIENSTNLIHYLLKYRYTDNWDRELHENYMGFTYQEIGKMLGEHPKYKEMYWKEFALPFLVKQVKYDFDIDFKYKTHIKIILKRGKIG